LSVNTLLTNPDELVSAFRDQGIDVEKVSFDIKVNDGSSSSFNTLRTFYGKIFKTPEFEKGFFIIQDFSSQIAVNLLEPFKGMKMLDICSAPGGKAITSAIKVDDNASITAIDVSSSRLFRVHENIKRMNINSLDVISADFMEHNFEPESFDRIFLDPPCSALGIMGRSPDVTWKKSPELIKELSSLQLRMFLRAMDLVKRGGKIVYSVCTFTQAETADVINNVLSANDNFRKTRDFIYTIPNDLGMDGLFIAVLEKK
ncbi:MAG: RsmB/NOP family class I SAM-dependent RNA methyltransferase, partial [Proteobacteria bacterium]|nr:RsmB/NOP family class I SAM-dependent RNA methyltransferase [Pseudomonadota bacterium]